MTKVRPLALPLEPIVGERGSTTGATGVTGLRTGWTTGTCASAAAKAAAIGLRDGIAPYEVEVGLPSGERVRFVVEPGPSGVANERVVVKDAGDDPDCTDGARITALVDWAGPDATATALVAGEGVGMVTKQGLGLAVGGPAINPVPRRMILQALAEVTPASCVVTFAVPSGEEMTAKTTNARLGIMGGISILGTTGIVRPFSTAAYRASVVQQVDVAGAQGERTIVLATGSRSEQHAMAALPEIPEVCFVEVGDFTGIALRRAASVGMQRAVFVGMTGKIAKLAAGVMMTHFHRSKVDNQLLREVAIACCASRRVVAAATETETARHFFETCMEEGALEPLRRLCEMAATACRAHVDGVLDVEVRMVDFEGAVEVVRA